MKSKFENLVHVVFEHAYFTKERFTGLAVTMVNGTQRTLINHSLIFKPLPGGFSILFNAGTVQSREALLKQQLTLQFHCTLKDPHFYNYTGLPPSDITQTVFFFHNRTADNTTDTGKAVLHAGDLVSEADLLPVKELEPIPFTKPFALLELELREQLADTYYIRFPPRSTRWRYIVVGDHLMKLDRPAILDAVSREVFEGPDNITLPDNRSALSFLSGTPVTLTDAIDRRCQLVENYDASTGKFKVVHTALPLPDVQVVSLAVPAKDNNANQGFSEIFIY